MNELFFKLKVALSSISNKDKIELFKKISSCEDIDDIIDFKNIKKLQEVSDDYINKFINIMKCKSIGFVCIYDNLFPSNLRFINNPPAFLFYKGNIEVLKNGNRNISIIGSRNCTEYGKKIAQILCSKICDGYVNTISGGAIGIDSLIHKNTLRFGGKTISVLGSGIMKFYPKTNEKLFELIQKEGCIISEFLPYEEPKPYNFPKRNRIISGLCDELVVIEGGERSGTSITVEFALEQGKDIFAFPGSIFSPKSLGTNKLIEQGAIPINNFNHILEILKIEHKNEKNEEDSDSKRKILKFLDKGPQNINDIITYTRIDISIIYELLFELQSKNEIVLLSGNYYAKID